MNGGRINEMHVKWCGSKDEGNVRGKVEMQALVTIYVHRANIAIETAPGTSGCMSHIESCGEQETAIIEGACPGP